MIRYVEYLINLNGKKSLFFSFLLGGLTALALPPLFIIVLAFIGFSSHILMLNQCKTSKHSFWMGWCFGFGYFTIGLYWISFALFVDIKQFGWLMPFAIFGIPSILAFYIAFVSLIAFKVKTGLISKVILYSVLWTVFEILRAKLFTGFPWNLLGYAWSFSDSILQITSIGGIWLLSYISILIFTIPSIVFVLNKENKVININYKPLFIVSFFIVIIFVWGNIRLNSTNTEYVDDIKVRIVQGNIDQSNKFDANHRVQILDKYKKLSSNNIPEDITHIIWPETAVPFYLDDKSETLTYLKDSIPKEGFLITGALRATFDDQENFKNIWNSIFTINSNGKILSYYDKSHLVPFGEYIPFKSILPFKKITDGFMDFTKGKGIKTINDDSFVPFSPLICYEVIFPDKVVNKLDRPSLLVNITNDAWYGNSSGPYQHFYMTKVRAIEQGIPLVRAANSGISAVFDSFGRVIVKTKLSTTDVIDSNLPKNINKITTFSRYGLIIILLLVLSSLPFTYLLRKY